MIGDVSEKIYSQSSGESNFFAVSQLQAVEKTGRMGPDGMEANCTENCAECRE
jgi:hypothetical protein